jgi:predicted flap endonuclease-1-like 5' DNA nuclease
MTELWNAYWPMILVAVAIGIVIGTLAFRKPKQKVTLSRAEEPVRPHMAASAAPAASVTHERQVPSPDDSDGGGEGEDVGDHMAAAATDVVGQVINAPVHDQLAGHQTAADDLQKLKGVGPKLASLLHSRGLFRFEQIAALTPDEVTALDADLGAFKGRLTRDRVIEQAGYLARGDQAGYEAAFGRL